MNNLESGSKRPIPLATPDIAQPSPSLLTYYFLTAALSVPFFVVVFPLLWIRFKTLKYELTESGIRMSVGLLFRSEVIVAFRRIQDIHVSNNIFQRWLGISNVSIQTASGNAMPEIVIEGVTDPNHVRDWLYERMRGAKNPSLEQTRNVNSSDDLNSLDEATELLRGIRDHLALMVKQSHHSAIERGDRP